MPTTLIVLIAGLGVLALATATWITVALLSVERAKRMYVPVRMTEMLPVGRHPVATSTGAGGGLLLRDRSAAEVGRRKADWDFQLDASLHRSARRRMPGTINAVAPGRQKLTLQRREKRRAA